MTDRVYLVEWFGVTAYISAPSRAKASMKAMYSAQEGGYWSPGQSMKGLRIRIAPYVPSYVAVVYAR